MHEWTTTCELLRTELTQAESNTALLQLDGPRACESCMAYQQQVEREKASVEEAAAALLQAQQAHAAEKSLWERTLGEYKESITRAMGEKDGQLRSAMERAAVLQQQLEQASLRLKLVSEENESLQQQQQQLEKQAAQEGLDMSFASTSLLSSSSSSRDFVIPMGEGGSSGVGGVGGSAAAGAATAGSGATTATITMATVQQKMALFLQGLYNFMRLVTNGRVGHAGAKVYFIGLHLFLLFLLFRCL